MKTFIQWIMEGRSFEYQGSRYSSFGKYYKKDGESISKEEYQKASEAYKNSGGAKKSTTKKTTKTKDESPAKKSSKKSEPKTAFDSIHAYCPTHERLKNTMYKPVKSLKECEEQIASFTGKKVFLSGITQKEVYNGIGASVHKVFSKYPYLGESKSLNYIATQAGMNKSVEDDVEEYMKSDYAKKNLQKDYDWIVKNFRFAQVGEDLCKNVHYTGMTLAEARKFRDLHGISWGDKVDERMSKLLIDKWYEIRKKKMKKNYKESLVPSEFKAKNAYAFYMTSKDDWSSWKKWSGIYFSPTNMKKSTTYYDLAVQQNFSPKGTDHTSIVTHELGHVMDNMLNLRVDDRIKELYRNNDAAAEVSKYAATHIKEFIAECFAEYMHSPEPRPVAKEVGKIIDEKYKLYAEATKVVMDKVKDGKIKPEEIDVYRDATIYNLRNKEVNNV